MRAFIIWLEDELAYSQRQLQLAQSKLEQVLNNKQSKQ